jgi:NitT/TauT family transport system ATP-binding protein
MAEVSPASGTVSPAAGGPTGGQEISISQVRKSYSGQDGADTVVLDGVDLTIGDGEFVTLLGPSGCGKTTLLKMIAGLIPYDGGEIRVNGTPVNGPLPECSMVFQGFALLPWASVLDNIAFGLRLRGVPKAERRDRARELVGVVGLAGFETSYPAQLSGGMQQRVGIARALAVEPKVLLMDEPFSALDEQTRAGMQEELLEVWGRSQLKVVFVTHSIEEALLLGDRVVVFGPRPSGIVDIVETGFDRPRSRATLNDPRFVEKSAYLWRMLGPGETESP